MRNLRGIRFRDLEAIIGTMLISLLVFATATVFVESGWMLGSFEIGVYTLVAAYMLAGLWRDQNESDSGGWPAYLIYLAPAWGIFQILAHTTSATFDTRAATLRWGALAGVFFLSRVITRDEIRRRLFLSIFIGFATCMALLCLTQLFTSEGHVLWIFSSGYPDVYGTFPNANNYAQFVELALPVALWRAMRETWRSWWYAICAGLLYASAIGASSRAGALLCTLELLTMLTLSLVKLRDPITRATNRSAIQIAAACVLLATSLTVAVGWQHVWERIETHDKFEGRRELLAAALGMAHDRPLTGYGLGTYPQVFQKYAVRDVDFYANFAHDDWAQFAAEGGIPFLIIILVPFVFAIPTAIRRPWGLGILAVMLHACVDYPFPRPAVSGWMFALLGCLYGARRGSSISTLSQG
jgi:O-antigen ligase